MSLLSGALLVLSFPQFEYYALAWIALVPLFVSLTGKGLKDSFILGMLAGFVYFLGTVYWVFHSMYYYGYIAAPLSVLILVVLCLYLALYIGIFALLFSYISRCPRIPALLTVPVLWVSLEFLRTYALTGFPWSSLGYSQYRFLFLIQSADITGVYGISFLVAATNAVIYDVTVSWPDKMRKEPLFPRWPLSVGLIVYALVVVGALLYGTDKFNGRTDGRKIKVSVMQGNIPQDKKWEPQFQQEVIDIYKRLSLSVQADSPDMIVWPETAVPFIFGDDSGRTDDMISFQQQLRTYLLFGSMFRKEGGGLSNSAVLLSPEGKLLSVYDKVHLVPYGEYVPLRRLTPFIEKITVGIGDFVPGRDQTVMKTPFARIGNLICYEIIFPGLVRKFAENGADLLVTITNDAWFGRTAAPYQHFSMAVFRAVENRVPVVRAANTGISGFIDSDGRILRQSDIFVKAALTGELAVGNEKSFYAEHGDVFAWLCVTCLVLLLIRSSVYRGI